MFTIFFFSALPSREQHSLKWKRVSYKWSTEIPFIINQLLLQLFNPFIRQVSLLQGLIVILWSDLKIERFNFFLPCIFKYSSTSGVLSRWNYLDGGRGGVPAWSKPRGDGSCPVSPTQVKLPLSHTMRGDLGLRSGKGESPGRWFLPCLKGTMQKPLLMSCINFSSIFHHHKVWTRMAGAAPTWDRAQPPWVSNLIY